MLIDKRAVTEVAKLRKKEHILLTAYRCFEKTNFKDLKMVDIAKEAGVAKGTLFNYFISKEHLFLEMLYYEYEQRFFNTKRLLVAEKGRTLTDFRDFILKELESVLNIESVFIKLEAIRSAILELNLDRNIVTSMDKLFKDQLEQTSKEIANKFNGVNTEEVMEIFEVENVFILGFYHRIKKSELIGNCKEASEFKQRTLQSMKHYLDGYFNRGSEN